MKQIIRLLIDIMFNNGINSIELECDTEFAEEFHAYVRSITNFTIARKNNSLKQIESKKHTSIRFLNGKILKVKVKENERSN